RDSPPVVHSSVHVCSCWLREYSDPNLNRTKVLRYDDNLEAPMSTPPHDISINNLWRRPIIPERKFSQLAEVNAQQNTESMYKFEQTAGLTDTSYTPHKGLTAEETRHHHRMPESLQIQSLEAREEKSSSAQSTPSNTPHSSPKLQRRGWFGSTSSEISISSSNSSVDMGGGGVPGEPVAGGAVERWGVFGPRLPVQSSTSDLGSDGSAAGNSFSLICKAQQFF
ncbi:hypothetical protein GOODEAATRI_025291, partial [Goodea atripinnis]